MIQIASRMQAFGFSSTLAMGRRAAALKAQGRDIISLALGEPDYPIPAAVRAATAEAAHRGEEKSPPVPGLPALRAAVAERLQARLGLPCTPDQVAISTGSKQAIFNAMMATLNPGDEVIIPAPYWVSYPDIVTLAQGVPVTVPCPAAQGHLLRPDQLEAAITPRTRWLILNSPNNPTGVVYPAASLTALAEVLRRHPQVAILSDDIYETLIFDGQPFASLATVAPDLADRILVVNGFSKTFGMIGWRIGYAAGPVPLIEEMTKVMSQVTSGTATIVQLGALAALRDVPEAETAANTARYQRLRDYVGARLARIPDLPVVAPGGAFYFYPDVSAYLGGQLATDVDLAAHLLDHAGVACVPGSAFGLGPALRLSYTCPESRLPEALDRIEDTLARLR